jgi:hypothetical protein
VIGSRDEALREASAHLARAMAALEHADRPDLSHDALLVANQVLHARQALIVEDRQRRAVRSWGGVA